MGSVKHIFVYVVDRPDDPFLGLKQLLSRNRLAQHVISEVRLPAESYEIVREVEYSRRRLFRFLYYKNIFRQLEKSLQQVLDHFHKDDCCVIYLSDEAVWAEFLRDFRKRHCEMKVVYVDVQHGFAYPMAAKYKNLRRAFNWIARKTLGYPALGMGSLGGAGGGVFDIYLTYDTTTSDFIRQHTCDLVYTCPFVIKFGLLQRYWAAGELLKEWRTEKDILFALQQVGKNNGDSLHLFEELLPVAKLLGEKYGKRLIFRPHPGMERRKVIESFHRSGIDRWADIDELAELADRLARCNIVMSFYSTVLWEAGMLGLVPVSVQGAYHHGRLPFSHEVLDVSADLDAQLDQILCQETAEKYRRDLVNDAFDWEAIIMGFVGEISPVNSQAGIAHPDSVA